MTAKRSLQVTRRRRGKLNAGSIIALCLLLVTPVYALSRLPPYLDWKALAAVPLAVSVFAFFAYRSDKRRTEAGEWRIPESTLHLIALIGGWPGAFLAQRAFRHKTSKLSFQFVFWSTVLLHQFAAVDSLLDWRLTKDVLRAVESRMA